MRTRRQRRSDLKLIAGSALLVIFAGGLLAAGIYVATSQGGDDACGEFNAGQANELRRRVEEDGPTAPLNGGASCTYILALDGEDLVAVRPVLERDGETCALQWRPSREAFTCRGVTVGFDEIDRYPTRIGTGELAGALLIDLRPATTTAARG